MLVVTLGNARLEGMHLSLAIVKSSWLDEEARWKDKEAISDPKTLVTESDTHRGRGRNTSQGQGEVKGETHVLLP